MQRRDKRLCPDGGAAAAAARTHAASRPSSTASQTARHLCVAAADVNGNNGDGDALHAGCATWEACDVQRAMQRRGGAAHGPAMAPRVAKTASQLHSITCPVAGGGDGRDVSNVSERLRYGGRVVARASSAKVKRLSPTHHGLASSLMTPPQETSSGRPTSAASLMNALMGLSDATEGSVSRPRTADSGAFRRVPRQNLSFNPKSPTPPDVSSASTPPSLFFSSHAPSSQWHPSSGRADALSFTSSLPAASFRVGGLGDGAAQTMRRPARVRSAQLGRSRSAATRSQLRNAPSPLRAAPHSASTSTPASLCGATTTTSRIQEAAKLAEGGTALPLHTATTVAHTHTALLDEEATLMHTRDAREDEEVAREQGGDTCTTSNVSCGSRCYPSPDIVEVWRGDREPWLTPAEGSTSTAPPEAQSAGKVDSMEGGQDVCPALPTLPAAASILTSVTAPSNRDRVLPGQRRPASPPLHNRKGTGRGPAQRHPRVRACGTPRLSTVMRGVRERFFSPQPPPQRPCQSGLGGDGGSPRSTEKGVSPNPPSHSVRGPATAAAAQGPLGRGTPDTMMVRALAKERRRWERHQAELQEQVGGARPILADSAVTRGHESAMGTQSPRATKYRLMTRHMENTLRVLLKSHLPSYSPSFTTSSSPAARREKGERPVKAVGLSVGSTGSPLVGGERGAASALAPAAPTAIDQRSPAQHQSAGRTRNRRRRRRATSSIEREDDDSWEDSASDTEVLAAMEEMLLSVASLPFARAAGHEPPPAAPEGEAQPQPTRVSGRGQSRHGYTPLTVRMVNGLRRHQPLRACVASAARLVVFTLMRSLPAELYRGDPEEFARLAAMERRWALRNLAPVLSNTSAMEGKGGKAHCSSRCGAGAAAPGADEQWRGAPAGAFSRPQRFTKRAHAGVAVDRDVCDSDDSLCRGGQAGGGARTRDTPAMSAAASGQASGDSAEDITAASSTNVEPYTFPVPPLAGPRRCTNFMSISSASLQPPPHWRRSSCCAEDIHCRAEGEMAPPSHHPSRARNSVTAPDLEGSRSSTAASLEDTGMATPATLTALTGSSGTAGGAAAVGLGALPRVLATTSSNDENNDSFSSSSSNRSNESLSGASGAALRGTTVTAAVSSFTTKAGGTATVRATTEKAFVKQTRKALSAAAAEFARQKRIPLHAFTTNELDEADALLHRTLTSIDAQRFPPQASSRASSTTSRQSAQPAVDTPNPLNPHPHPHDPPSDGTGATAASKEGAEGVKGTPAPPATPATPALLRHSGVGSSDGDGAAAAPLRRHKREGGATAEGRGAPFPSAAYAQVVSAVLRSPALHHALLHPESRTESSGSHTVRTKEQEGEEEDEGTRERQQLLQLASILRGCRAELPPLVDRDGRPTCLAPLLVQSHGGCGVAPFTGDLFRFLLVRRARSGDEDGVLAQEEHGERSAGVAAAMRSTKRAPSPASDANPTHASTVAGKAMEMMMMGDAMDFTTLDTFLAKRCASPEPALLPLLAVHKVIRATTAHNTTLPYEAAEQVVGPVELHLLRDFQRRLARLAFSFQGHAARERAARPRKGGRPATAAATAAATARTSRPSVAKASATVPRAAAHDLVEDGEVEGWEEDVVGGDRDSTGGALPFLFFEAHRDKLQAWSFVIICEAAIGYAMDLVGDAFAGIPLAVYENTLMIRGEDLDELGETTLPARMLPSVPCWERDRHVAQSAVAAARSVVLEALVRMKGELYYLLTGIDQRHNLLLMHYQLMREVKDGVLARQHLRMKEGRVVRRRTLPLPPKAMLHPSIRGRQRRSRAQDGSRNDSAAREEEVEQAGKHQDSAAASRATPASTEPTPAARTTRRAVERTEPLPSPAMPPSSIPPDAPQSGSTLQIAALDSPAAARRGTASPLTLTKPDAVDRASRRISQGLTRTPLQSVFLTLPHHRSAGRGSTDDSDGEDDTGSDWSSSTDEGEAEGVFANTRAAAGSDDKRLCAVSSLFSRWRGSAAFMVSRQRHSPTASTQAGPPSPLSAPSTTAAAPSTGDLVEPQTPKEATRASAGGGPPRERTQPSIDVLGCSGSLSALHYSPASTYHAGGDCVCQGETRGAVPSPAGEHSSLPFAPLPPLITRSSEATAGTDLRRVPSALMIQAAVSEFQRLEDARVASNRANALLTGKVYEGSCFRWQRAGASGTFNPTTATPPPSCEGALAAEPSPPRMRSGASHKRSGDARDARDDVAPPSAVAAAWCPMAVPKTDEEGKHFASWSASHDPPLSAECQLASHVTARTRWLLKKYKTFVLDEDAPVAEMQRRRQRLAEEESMESTPAEEGMRDAEGGGGEDGKPMAPVGEPESFELVLAEDPAVCGVSATHGAPPQPKRQEGHRRSIKGGARANRSCRLRAQHTQEAMLTAKLHGQGTSTRTPPATARAGMEGEALPWYSSGGSTYASDRLGAKLLRQRATGAFDPFSVSPLIALIGCVDGDAPARAEAAAVGEGSAMAAAAAVAPPKEQRQSHMAPSLQQRGLRLGRAAMPWTL